MPDTCVAVPCDDRRESLADILFSLPLPRLYLLRFTRLPSLPYNESTISPWRFFQANFFGHNRFEYGLPQAYTYTVRYIRTRKPHARSEESHNTTEAQSRFSCGHEVSSFGYILQYMY